MKLLLAALRTLLFTVAFYGLTIPLLLVAYVVRLRGPAAVIPVAVVWSRLHRFLARWLLGQRVIVEGHIPPGPHFFVMKHEAMFETLDLPALLDRPVVAAKQELLALPLWGSLARSYGVLAVNREAGASALRTLRTQARAAVAGGRSLCLFPEGTRVPHGEAPPLKSGFAGLYSLLALPVVPVAVDSGRLNRKGVLVRRPGVIRYRFGAVIPPGLDRRTVEAEVHRAINALNGAHDDGA